MFVSLGIRINAMSNGKQILCLVAGLWILLHDIYISNIKPKNIVIVVFLAIIAVIFT